MSLFLISVVSVDDLVQRPVLEAFFEVDPDPGEDLFQPRPDAFYVFADNSEVTYLSDFFEPEPERGEEFIEFKNDNDSFNIIGSEIVILSDVYEVEEPGLETFDARGYPDEPIDPSVLQLIDPPFIPPIIGSEFTQASLEEFVIIPPPPVQRKPLFSKGYGRFWKGRSH